MGSTVPTSTDSISRDLDITGKDLAVNKPMEKNYRCKSYTPTSGGTHRSIAGKDDGVVNPPSDLMDLRSAETSAAKKFSLQALNPRGRRGTGLRQKDDGGGPDDLEIG